MAEFPALPLWTDAFIGDTHHLTPAECGAYIRLLMAAWRSPDCSLPSDDKTLGRMIGEPRNWKRLKPTVLAFWTLGEDGRYRQKRLSREYEFVTSKRILARTAANAKWLKHKQPGNASASPEHMPTTPTPTPTKEIPPNGGCQNAARSDPLPCQQAFENWNKIAEANGLPKATKLTEERRRHLKARLREFGIDGWNEALWKIEGNKFFHGDNDRGWTATLDFLLRPSKFARVLEGGYDRKDCEA